MQENLLKQNIQQNLLLFTEWMGYTNAAFHETWYNFLDEEFSPLKHHPERLKKYLQLWPRGHGKTTAIILYILWLIGNYPNIHIQIVSKTASQSESLLSAIITTIEHSEPYRKLFGNLKPDQPIKWTAQQFIVKRNEISKNPTVKATGIFGATTGGRNDLIICDDLIDEENVRTRLQIEKAKTWFYKILYPTLYPWGGIIVIGTRYSYADLYASLIETWPHSILKAINGNKVLWPQYWPLSKLELRRKEIGSIIFNCQYQNDPTGMEGDLLKAEWLHPYLNEPPNALSYYAGVDPALGEGDLQAIATIAYDRKRNQAYLVDVWADKLPFPLFLRKIKEMHNNYHYSKIYVESNAFQKILVTLPELHQGLPISDTVTDRDKERRFIALSSHFESGRIQVNPTLLDNSEFFNEWVQFPRGQYDDAVDSVELVVRNVITSAHKKTAWTFGG